MGNSKIIEFYRSVGISSDELPLGKFLIKSYPKLVGTPGTYVSRYLISSFIFIGCQLPMPVEIMAQLGNESNVSKRILSKKDFYLT